MNKYKTKRVQIAGEKESKIERKERREKREVSDGYYTATDELARVINIIIRKIDYTILLIKTCQFFNI